MASQTVSGDTSSTTATGLSHLQFEQVVEGSQFMNVQMMHSQSNGSGTDWSVPGLVWSVVQLWPVAAV
ncbi:hypothetical protein PR002_g10012 [Phytophthora rubi]|uniref:Uncharacterized protein n=1 Tax=Phytophthora rubi TaxID=129364 RepID=A0A6A3MC45_9STRA|nr:hypothetical protein PR002_g10012 [Phytophthora rubi]